MTLPSAYDDYLRDESRLIGSADSISFPKTEAEVIETVKSASGLPIIAQGARTGIVAGAVPQGGHILNLSRMTEISPLNASGRTIRVQPGVLLTAIRGAIEPANLLFPPDPTETSASIGGMAACNASGALTYFYGPTRDWVCSLRVVLANGSILALKRGENFAKGRSFAITTEDGATIEGNLPSYTMPKVKSAAGYYIADNMDMIDLFIGMEGTLGIITEVELSLIPRPETVFALTVFMPTEDLALDFVRILRGEGVANAPNLRPVAIEFFDHNALDLLRRMKEEYSAFADIPALQPHFHTAVYTEFHSNNPLDETIEEIMNLLETMEISDEDTWCATNYRELERLKAFRHAVPEAVNLLIDKRKKNMPALTKLGTDMSAPDSELKTIMAMYRTDLAASALESVIFGHIGNNHVHVNILPNSPEDYETGKKLYANWAERIVKLGGSISAEHGIGKIKPDYLRLMYGDLAITEMRALKHILDPHSILNPNNLFPP